jgi:hypothetical protein
MPRRTALCTLLAASLLSPVTAHNATAEDCDGFICGQIMVADDDLPLSLLQVKAIATRNAKTPVPKKTMSGTLHRHLAAVFQGPFDFLRFRSADHAPSWQASAATFAIAFCSFLVLLNACMMCLQPQVQEAVKKISGPRKYNAVDHLVATSKLDWQPDALKVRRHSFVGPLSDSAPPEDSKKGLYPDVLTQDSSGVISSERLEDKKASEKATCAAMVDDWPFAVLDPRLVLPLRETWYAVAIENVLRVDGTFDILRITGSPSLHAKVSYGRGAALELFSRGGSPSATNPAQDQLLARASTGQLQKFQMPAEGHRKVPNAPPLLLVDAHGQSLGELRSSAGHSFNLVHNGQAILRLEEDDDGQLKLTGTTGKRLACISYVAGHLGICINAAVDTGLVVCLCLAAVLLGGASSLVLCGGDGDVKQSSSESASDMEPQICRPKEGS